MRHNKHTFKVGRNCGHRRSLLANMLKALVEHEKIETSVAKAKELRRHADRLITMAKKNTLASRRQAISDLMITFNPLTSKETRIAKKGDTSIYNNDRKVITKLFDTLSKRYEGRNGGFTRIIKGVNRIGDNAQTCIIEYLPE
ncbi:MAG: 50S ribosomal protein L17 [Chlamydiae bacterium]|nr:50S ribosomal protein L17 [Chlamydiota bacterium]